MYESKRYQYAYKWYWIGPCISIILPCLFTWILYVCFMWIPRQLAELLDQILEFAERGVGHLMNRWRVWRILALQATKWHWAMHAHIYIYRYRYVYFYIYIYIYIRRPFQCRACWISLCHLTSTYRHINQHVNISIYQYISIYQFINIALHISI